MSHSRCAECGRRDGWHDLWCPEFNVDGKPVGFPEGEAEEKDLRDGGRVRLGVPVGVVMVEKLGEVE